MLLTCAHYLRDSTYNTNCKYVRIVILRLGCQIILIHLNASIFSCLIMTRCSPNRLKCTVNMSTPTLGYNLVEYLYGQQCHATHSTLRRWKCQYPGLHKMLWIFAAVTVSRSGRHMGAQRSHSPKDSCLKASRLGPRKIPPPIAPLNNRVMRATFWHRVPLEHCHRPSIYPANLIKAGMPCDHITQVGSQLASYA